MRISDWSSGVCSSDLIMLLPRWFPFHLSKVSYWSRTVIAPLLVVMDRKPRAANPRGVSIRELFRDDPARATYNMNASGSPLGSIRSEERRGGKAWVSKCGARWAAVD